MKKDLTIKRLKNTSFPIVYKKFLLNQDMDNYKYIKILSLATIFINSDNEYIKQLGYRIFIIYSNQTQNYKPLYEISLNFGLIPIASFIQRRDSKYTSLYSEVNAAFIELFNHNNIYYSEQQSELLEFYRSKKDSTIAVIAPTSYGKTELIITTLKESKNKNICVITPTKSLLAQTKIRIMNENIDWIKKIVTHPEMFNEKDTYTVAVLTQERLLRLLKNVPQLSFDYVIIDEAHELLNADDRSILLATAIIILSKRNDKTIFKFLTPFLCDSDNLQVKYSNNEISSYKISENIKSERFYIFDKNELLLYDQFLDEFYFVENRFEDGIDFIKNNKAGKNIIYLNRPIDIENFSIKLSERSSTNSLEDIEKACKSIAEYMHPQYTLINCLRKGIIYHHGSVPDNIRIYIEYLYSNIEAISYVITSSTLLEGVNLPAEKMFILDNKKGIGYLSPSNFKNLIGRVCRLSDIFNSKSGNLRRLEPSIYLVSSDYYNKNADLKNFLSDRTKVDRDIKDSPKNVLLEKTKIDDDNVEKSIDAQEFIGNFEDGIIDNNKIRYVTTEIGKRCFQNNITEIDIFLLETKLQEEVDELAVDHIIINNTESLFVELYKIFFSNVIDNQRNQNLKRFQYPETRNFYKMFLDWRIKSATYKEMIASFLIYWEKASLIGRDPLIYVGRWGDETREGVRKFWTNISRKTTAEKINLAIVRIKDEQDFLDNKILKFIEVLNDLKLIDKTFFLKIKYGTDDERVIVLVNNGLSLSLSKLLVAKYINYVSIDIYINTVSFNREIVNKMKLNDENQVMLYEIKYFLNK